MKKERRLKKQKENRISAGEQAVHVLNLPPDCVLGDALLSAIGNRTLYIENYSRILCYEDDCIRIECRHGMITLTGARLTIAYFNAHEMKITGKIEQIRFS